MKKLYLFGDSFSLFTEDIKDYYLNDIEFNTHHSLSNDHILKLVKLKLIRLYIMELTLTFRLLTFDQQWLKLV